MWLVVVMVKMLVWVLVLLKKVNKYIFNGCKVCVVNNVFKIFFDKEEEWFRIKFKFCERIGFWMKGICGGDGMEVVGILLVRMRFMFFLEYCIMLMIFFFCVNIIGFLFLLIVVSCVDFLEFICMNVLLEGFFWK